jgi:Tol biopolymer transport system component
MAFVRRAQALLLVLACLMISPPVLATQVELISRAEPSLLAGSGGSQSATGGVTARTVSVDGRFTVFTSTAANLVTGQSDGNGGSDVFLYDRTAGTVTLVSHAAAGLSTAANGVSDQPAISADGSRVAYLSTASDLVSGQVEGGAFGSQDVFLWDRATGATALASHTAASAVTTADQPSNGPLGLSADGSWLAFASGGTNLVTGQSGPVGESSNVFLFDASAGTNVLVTHDAAAPATVANGFSGGPLVSADGRYVAYGSSASNLVAGYIATSFVDSNAYLWDRTTGASILASHTAGQPARGGPSSTLSSMSADGRYVAYSSGVTDLVAGVTDSNLNVDAFVYDRDTDTNQLLDFPAGSPSTTPTVGASSPVISADGAWIAFQSSATNLVAGQSGTSLHPSLFLTARATGSTVLVSHADGAPTTVVASGPQGFPSLSDDGRWVVFDSPAANLTAGDTNGAEDVFLYDRTTGTNALVSHAAGSASSANADSLSPTVSGDGSVLVYASDASNLDNGVSDTNGARDVFLHDRASSANTLISTRAAGLPSATAGGDSSTTDFPRPTVTPDGRWVAFTSSAPNLVPGQVDTNNANDVFLRDRQTGTTVLVSRSSAAAATAGNRFSAGPSISSDGRYVAFVSLATDLVAGQTDTNNATDIFLFDRVSGTTTLVSHVSASAVTAGNKASDYLSIAPDGSHVAFASLATDLVAGVTEGNPWNDVFLYDRASGSLTLVSHTAAAPLTTGNQESSGPTLLGDGSVLYLSTASNLVSGQTDSNVSSDLFLYTPATDSSLLVSHVSGAPATAGNGAVVASAASADSRWIAFSSRSTNLLPGITDANNVAPDVFLFDRTTGTASLISHTAASTTQTGGGASWVSALSEDGRWIAFTSSAADLVNGQIDTNGLDDVFLHDRTTGETVLVTHAPGTPATAACCSGGAFSPHLSANASTVAYYSLYINLVSQQVTPGVGVFVYDRAANANAVASHSLLSPVRTGNAESNVVDISADGSTIVFTSAASDLVPGDLNGRKDVFVYRNGQVGSYYTLTPCRLLDTRDPADGPALFSGQTAVLLLHGACGIPETAKAVAVNVTVVQPSGAGFLTLHPGDIAPPATSTLNFEAGQTRANNAIQRLALNGAGTMAVTPFVSGVGGNGTVHVIVDVVGYFE